MGNVSELGLGKAELAKLVVQKLCATQKTLSLAESCTGGMISATITDVPGASEVFTECIVTYSNEAKQNRLMVSGELLERFGAVSCECVEQMLLGLISISKTSLALTISGIAGPDGGTDEKPVGTVYIACGNKNKVTAKKYVFSGNRDMIRQKATTKSLNILLDEISKGE